MLMDYELNVHVNELIAELVKQAKEEYYTNLDMFVTQDSKYRNTEYDEITIGLGSSKGLPTNLYYFNAINDDTQRENVDMYYDEPVSYYENCGKGCMMYRIVVDTMSRHVVVYQVVYEYRYKPQYSKIKVLDFGDSKFRKKVQVVS